MKDDPDFMINRDYLNYVPFVEHFRTKTEWKPYFDDSQGIFMKLLTLDNLFFDRKVVSFTKKEVTQILSERILEAFRQKKRR